MKEVEECMLTTVDNPYDPFTQFDEWYVYDTQHGYNSCSLLDRFSDTSESLSEYENQVELNRAMDKIVELDLTGLYKKISKPGPKKG